MPARACPRCRQPLEIPQPQPAKVQCPRCQAILRLSAPAAAGAVKAATAPLAPSQPVFLPFTEGADATLITTRRRRRSSGGFLWILVFLIVVGAPILAFVLLRQKNDSPPSVAKTAVSSPSTPNAPVAAAVVSPLNFKRPPANINQPAINEAIRKGVEYLKNEIMVRDRLYHRSELADVAPANAHLGAIALAGLTLLECGISPDDPAVQKAAQAIRDNAVTIQATYALATAILFLDRLHANIPSTDGVRLNEGERSTLAKKERDREFIRALALRLMARQDEGGFWGYGPSPRDGHVTKAEEEETYQKAKAGQTAGAKLYYKNLSNSQFAALALWAARRHGVPVQPALKAVARAARAEQTAEGTWNYDLNLSMKHTSACAGLIFLALERGLEEEGTIRKGGKAADPKLNRSILDDPAVKKGMEFLGKFLAKPPTLSAQKKEDRIRSAKKVKEYYEKYENKVEVPPAVSWTMEFAFSGTIFGADSWGDLYLLWSIERVGVIYDVREIQPPDGKDWYAWGSGIIVANQKDGGLWEDRFPGVPDTCFALLFLKRANIAKDLTDKLREILSWNANAPGNPPTVPKRKE